MCRNISRIHLPLQLALPAVAKQSAGRYIIDGIGNIYIPVYGIHFYPIGQHNIPIGTVGNKVVRHHLLGTDIHDSISDLVLPGLAIPPCSTNVGRIARNIEVGDRYIHSLRHSFTVQVDYNQVR